MEAFAGESMARNKYTYFASKAKKDGYQQIAAIFEETAANEKEHAKLWFKLLCGGAIPSTEENLVLAAAGENEEWTDMYARMAEEADAEGFADIAQLFRSVGAIEKSTRSATSSCLTMCAAAAFLQSARRSSGYAATADTFTRVPRLPKAARPARIPRAISS